MMNRDEVIKCVVDRHPASSVRCRMTLPCRNSKVFFLELSRDGKKECIVVKHSRNHMPQEVATEYANLSRFYTAPKSGFSFISSPRPIFADGENGVLAMSHIDGTLLSHMLHEVRPVSASFLGSAIDLSAHALAEYHRIFRHEHGSLKIDLDAREGDVNRFLAESRPLLSDCNLREMVTPFFDFTPWNIMIKRGSYDDDMRLFLIDFPRRDYICTPHLDLSRFRFSLELVKQFPPAKLFGINRWNVDSLFDRFLSVYCGDMGTGLSSCDRYLIERGRIAYLSRAQDLKRKGSCGWQPRIEMAYLQTFCRDWLAEGR